LSDAPASAAPEPAAPVSAVHDPSGLAVLRFALAEREAGRAAAIATLAAVEGASPRRIGAQMGVAEDGRFVGSISSGCVERAIAAEAVAAMAAGEGRTLRYGAGSPFRDIVLPCGSGIDVLVSPVGEAGGVREAVRALEGRTPAALDFSVSGAAAPGRGAGAGAVRRAYAPPVRIVAAGLGEDLVAFSRLAAAAGYDVSVLSPEAETLERCAGRRVRLRSTSSVEIPALDPWSAFVLMFHDRDWEVPLAASALASEAFFIGAVGGARTQGMRLDALREAGVPEGALSRLRGPIGLIPATRDPVSLAVSILAQIVAEQPA